MTPFLTAVLFVLCTLLAVPAWAASPDACPPAAQAPTPEQAQAAMKSARDRGFLWRVSKDGRTSWLFGTVHIARSDWMAPGPALLDALRASDVVALELDVLDPDIMERLRSGMAARADRPLAVSLADRMKAQLRAACLPEQLMGAMAPEMLATTLMVMSARREGLDPAYAIDAAIAGLGRGLKKPVTSLETPELQVALLLARTPQEAHALVEQVLAELEQGRASPMLARIAQLWSDSRLAELERYEQWCRCVDTAEERAMLKRLLDDRNPGLAERIDRLHADGRRVFAAVGALHMIGPTGLPTLLARRGYQVERIDFAR
jgi:uncharacterized protein YbaP (TraB family)